MKKLIACIWICLLGVLSFGQNTLSVGLKWSPGGTEEIGGYRVYRGTSPGKYDWKQDFGLETQASIDGLVPGVTYYFVVTAFLEKPPFSLESAPSNEVSYTAPGGAIVTIPTGWSIVRSGITEKTIITWDEPPDDQLVQRWRVKWWVKGALIQDESLVSKPKISIDTGPMAAEYTVSITPEGLAGSGPTLTIDIPKFSIPSRLEIEPGTLKVVYAD